MPVTIRMGTAPGPLAAGPLPPDPGDGGPSRVGAADQVPVTATGDTPVGDLDPTGILAGMRGDEVRTASDCPTCGTVFSGAARFCPFDGEALRRLPAWRPEGDPLVGREVAGRYRVERLLGEGGMGKVYAARHLAIDKPCALKVLRREVAVERDAVDRFLQEAKITASLSHPSIVSVSDFGELGETELPGLGDLRLPWFTMDLLDGETLAERLRRERPLEPAEAAAIGRACAEGLAAAHARGVVHRDLKPDNVFLVRSQGEGVTAKLLDFGVAQVADGSRRTRKGMTFGTPHYMSPEQAMGGTIDGRADLYALGIILYECVAGEVPFVADTFMGVLTKHVYATPEPLERVVDAARLGELGLIVARCLEKEPAARFADATALATALAGAGRGAPRPAASGNARATVRRRRDEVLGREPARRDLPAIVPAPRARRAPLVAAGVVVVLLGAGAWLARRPPADSPGESGPSRPVELAAPTVSVLDVAIESPPPLVPLAEPAPSTSAAPSVAPAAATRAPSSEPGAAPQASATAAPRAAPPAPPTEPRHGEVIDPWSD